MVALLMVEVWPRYVAVASLKQRNAQTVGRALASFIGSVRDGTVDLAFDNEPVLGQVGQKLKSPHILLPIRLVTNLGQASLKKLYQPSGVFRKP